MLETWDAPSTASLERPKSETFALMCLSRRILLLFKSLWIMAGTQPVWRYSIPEQAQFWRFSYIYSAFQCEISLIEIRTFCSIFGNLKALDPINAPFSCQGTCKSPYTDISLQTLWFITKATSTYHIDVPSGFHYAWIHKQAYFALLLDNIQETALGFYDVFLKEEPPTSNISQIH